MDGVKSTMNAVYSRFFNALPHEVENPTGSFQTDTPNPTWINNLSIGFRGWFSKFWNIHSDKRTWQGNIAHFFIFGLDMVMFHDHVGLRLGRQQLGRGDKTDQPVDDSMDPYVLNLHQQPISLADVHISLPLFFLSYCNCLIHFFGCLNPLFAAMTQVCRRSRQSLNFDHFLRWKISPNWAQHDKSNMKPWFLREISLGHGIACWNIPHFSEPIRLLKVLLTIESPFLAR